MNFLIIVPLQAFVKLKPEKKSVPNSGIRTHDLCDTGAALYQLSYQTKWEPATLWGHIIAIEGFESRSGRNFFQALISQLLKLCA